jgi:hypothetical protein
MGDSGSEEVGYSFPGPFTPMPNQLERFHFLLRHQYAFDLSETRTGKTATAIWAADYLMGQVGGSILVLAPKTTLETVWRKHYELITGDTDASFCVLSGSNVARARQISETKSCAFVSNYECLLSTAVRNAIHTSDIHTIIVDECSKFKHYKHNSSDSQSLHAGLREIAIDRNVWGLTATPMANSPMNAYGVARAIRQDYREAMTRFRNRTHTHVSQFEWVPLPCAVEAAYQILQPSIRVLREDCYAIPDATTERRLVQLGDDAQKAYKQLRKEAFLELKTGIHISAPHEAGLRNKLLQVAGGAVYTNNESFAFDPGERAREVLNLLEDTEGKVVILVPYRNQLELVKEFVTKAGYTCACIHGDVSAKDRGRLIDLFERTRHPRVLAADPRTLSHGVELSAAGVICWYLPPDSNEVYRQANDRPIHRGQTKGVLIVQLCGTVEEAKIYDRLEKRQKLQGVLLESLLE